MPGETINFELKVNSNIKRETQEAKEFHKTISAAAAAAQNIEYGRARGAMGSTGASARDFANQAQGLGGLVRIYATVAANSFAAISAFNALKSAADTTTLREGLNQLGAASGVALGNLAENFVKVTDGAISFRDAASAAAKATSAGLTSRQFLQIGESAKKASQALGIDMNDAVNRLTRGITKLEPELLDELGIYTKIGPAVEEYARTLGKSEASLTDFERRQAFAVAVLTEANKKFGEIDIPSNPYQKLEASLKNLTQAGLEFINKFLQPIASIFANNTNLLAIALGAVAIKLTQMAIPAVTSWRDQLRNAADSAKAYAANINQVFGEKQLENIQKGFGVPNIQAELSKNEAAYKASRDRLLEIESTSGEKRRSQIYKNLEIPQDTAQLKKVTRSIQSEIRSLTELGSDPTASAETTRRAQERVILLEQQKKLLQEQVRITKDLATANAQAYTVAEQAKPTFAETMRGRISRQAGARAERLGIVADIGSQVEVEGFTTAIKDMYKKVGDSKQMGAFDKLRTVISGTFAAGLTGLNMFLRAFGAIGQAIGLGIAALSALDGWFSKNTKQTEEFNKELKSNQETIDNAGRVLKKYKDSFPTTENLSAIGTSLGELSTGVDTLSNKLNDTLANQGVWDILKQGILSIFNQSATQDFAGAVADNWMKQIELLPEGELKSAVAEKLRSILNISEISRKGLKKAIEEAPSPESVVKKGQEALKPAVVFQQELGFTANQTKESISALNKASLDLQNSFIDQSPISKFAEALVKASLNISDSFKNVRSGFAGISEILNKPSAFALVNQEFVSSLKEAVDAKRQNIELDKQIASNQEYINKLQKDYDNLQKSLQRSALPNSIAQPMRRQLAGLGQALGQARIEQAGLQVTREANQENEKYLKAINAGREAFTKSIIEGFKLLSKAVDFAKIQSQLENTRGILGDLSAGVSPGLAAAQLDLAKQSIDLERQQLDVSANLANQLTLNTIAQTESNVLLAQANLERDIAKSGKPATSVERDLLENFKIDLQQLESIKDTIAKGGSISPEIAAQLRPSAGGIALQYKMRGEGEAAKKIALAGKETAAANQEQIGTLREQFAIEERQYALAVQSVDNQQKRLTLQNSSLSILTEEQLKSAQRLETEKLQKTQAQDRNKLSNLQIEDEAKLQQLLQLSNGVQNSQTIAVENRLKLRADEINNLKEQQNFEFNILSIQQKQAQELLRFNRETEKRNYELGIREKVLDVVDIQLTQEAALLDINNQRGMLSAQEYADNKKAQDLRRVDFDERRAQEQAINAEIEGRRKLQLEENQARKAGTLDPETIADLDERRRRLEDLREAELRKIKASSDAKRESIYLTNKETEREKAYADAFKNTFNSMADAIVSWAETGKWAGKDLFKSLTADLLRYELRLQMSEVYRGVRNPLLNAFGFGNLGAAATAAEIPFAAIPGLAKGDYFNNGIMPYAKGGMFTNSIVDQPTLFKFAKGTGLMGEAGPEAIMPLKRDSQGNLGVRGNGQKTEVIVNNYSGTPATTQESTDSRGNRKIEVIIGEAAATDIGRSGSNSQRAMRGTFGLRPQLLRR